MNNCLMGFNGERPDLISGNTHLGNGYRDYNPLLMRFSGPDSWSPFGAGGINPYRYCDGDPINRADPSGHVNWPGWLGIGLGILGISAALITGGASIAAAGSLSAAIDCASSLTLLTGTSGLIADISGIASLALAHSDRKASGVLSWVSFACGMLSLGVGLAFTAYRRMSLATGEMRKISSSRTTWGDVDDIENVQMLGAGASASTTRATDIYYSFDDLKNGSRRLNVVAHGRFERYLNYTTIGLNQVSTRYNGQNFAVYLNDMGIDFSEYTDAGVRMIVCFSADGADSFAAQFSRQAGLTVKAYSGPVTTEGELQSMVNAHALPDNLERLFNGDLTAAEEQLNEELMNLSTRDNLFHVIKENRGQRGGYNPVTIPFMRR
ncbi:RHS repeat-associated core domain-containing protein [Winslowiella iniecta]|uniref:RHS repeat-associated core domain-containing protein n=1 Tax=Winslowiella iniecta TaxID=1560201 RepID=UPI00069D7001|nr:RHS repeat-associated core domain-containing protein [Winslowiella iniecta]